MENDAAYGRPHLEMAPEVSGASLTLPGRPGRRRTVGLSGPHGSFYLREAGELAGFSLLLTIPPPASRRRAPESLSWEAVDLAYSDRNNFTGEGRLRLNGREVWATTYGQIVQVPGHGASRQYLRIVLAADFRAFALGWPGRAFWPLKPARLQVFTEIHARRRR